MRFVACLSVLVVTLACAGRGFAQEAVATFGVPQSEASETILIHGSTDIDAFAPVLTGFAASQPGLSIVYEQRSTNDIYALGSRACATNTENADLLISSSIDQQIKLVNDGCALEHASDLTEALPDWANWRDEVFGLTFEPAVMVYNRVLVRPDQVPKSRFDLIDLLRLPDRSFAGRVATYDIERSGLGYLFAFADAQQATTFGRLIEAFGASRAATTCCSAEIIDAVADGRYLIGYNLLGSYALARAAKDDRIGIVAPSDYTLLLSRAALVPKTAKNPDAAKRLIDFALSEAGKNLLVESALIVQFGDNARDDAAAINALSSTLRPLAFSPTLLVGLDRQKRDLFIDLWRSSLRIESGQ